MTTVVEEIQRIKSMDTSKLNESTATTAIVMPILRSLGWDTTDPDEVHMEYRVATHADIALLSQDTPLILIETKVPNRSLEIAKHEIQVLEYCQMKQVRIGVLTNGLEWRIYYLEAGIDKGYSDKGYSLAKVIRLVHGKTDESAATFAKFLSRDSVSDKRALTHAKHAWHESILSNLWKDLLVQGDKTLVNRLKKEVKERCHVNIPPDDVRKFIVARSTLPETTKEVPATLAATPPDNQEIKPPLPKKSSSVRARVFGVESEYDSLRAVMIDFVMKACHSNPEELEKLNQCLMVDNKKAIIMAYGTEKPPSLKHAAKKLGRTDYWLNVNLDRKDLKRQCNRIRQALSLTEDVLVWLD